MQVQFEQETAYFGKLPMCVSVAHELSLKNFKLGDDGKSSKIDTGILPFAVTPPGATSVEATARQDEENDAMLDYAVVYDGNGNGLTLAEAHVMRKSCAYLSNIWKEGKGQIWAYLTAFSALHGRNYHITIELHEAIKLFVLYRPSFK